MVLTRSEDDVDRIFKEEINKELKNDQFCPILPPDQQARRTVLAFNVDEHIQPQ